MSQMIQFLLSNATSPSIGPAVALRENDKINVRVVATGTGDVGAIVILEGSIDGKNWFDYAIIDLAGIKTVADGGMLQTYPHIRANLAAISGNDAQAMVFFQPGQ